MRPDNEQKASAVMPSIEAIMPAEMAERAEQIGIKKAAMNWKDTFGLAVLAGAFIALGSVFCTTVLAGTEGRLPFGVARLLGGLVFSLGLILVVIAGAELFTGNNLIVMAWASKKVATRRILRNWAIVYMGNFCGALLTGFMIWLTQHHRFGNGTVGVTLLNMANAKCQLGFVQAIALGAACNALVCMAVWLCYSARTSTDKILSVILPVSAFVAAGFEHSVANMYLIPKAIFTKAMASTAFWTMTGKTQGDYDHLTWIQFLVHNLLPVTIGNIIGGSVMVGLVYWFVYLRRTEA